jgi:glycerol-3-phosphate acyltransferase PlsY
LGAIFGLSWIAGLACVGAWLLAGLGSGYSSVGSLAASIVAPLALLIATRQLPQTVYGLLSALLIVYTHRENIARLRGGRENPIRLFSRGAPE